MNILMGNWLESDKELFFGPLKEDKFIEFEGNFPQLLKQLGIFSSTSDARRNGFINIPKGYSEHTIGKRKIKLYILNVV